MNPPESTAAPADEMTPEEAASALFTGLILQQTQMALMLLGRLTHPETGETVRDMDGARMMIDQLEMLEVKTQGNLSEAEARLLKQNLTALRMAFVEAVEAKPESAAAASSTATPPEVKAPTTGPADAASPADAESRKKFSKKY